MTDTPSAVEQAAFDHARRALRMDPPDKWTPASAIRQWNAAVQDFKAGAAWRAQSSEHEAERRRLEQAVVEAAQITSDAHKWNVESDYGVPKLLSGALYDQDRKVTELNAFLDAERAEGS